MNELNVLIEDELLPLVAKLFDQVEIGVDVLESGTRNLNDVVHNGYAAMMVGGRTEITGRVLDAAGKQLVAIGVVDDTLRNLNVVEATQRGIIVKITEYGNTYQIANLAKRMIVYVLSKGFLRDDAAGAHKITQVRSIVPESYTGFEMSDKTVGLIGCGRVAQALAREVRPFCREVIGYDDDFPSVHRRFHAPSPLESPVIEYCQFSELLERADVISIHTSGELRVFRDDRIPVLKRRPFIVDTARDGTINEDLLLYALKNGLIRGLALTVPRGHLKKDRFTEPVSRLAQFGNVLLAPSLGKTISNSHERNSRKLAQSIIGYLRNGDLSMAVNPDVVVGEKGRKKYPLRVQSGGATMRLRLNV